MCGDSQLTSWRTKNLRLERKESRQSKTVALYTAQRRTCTRSTRSTGARSTHGTFKAKHTQGRHAQHTQVMCASQTQFRCA